MELGGGEAKQGNRSSLSCAAFLSLKFESKDQHRFLKLEFVLTDVLLDRQTDIL